MADQRNDSTWPLRFGGSLTVTRAGDRLTVTGSGDRLVVETDSLATLNALRKTLQEAGSAVASGDSAGANFGFLDRVDVTVEVRLRGVTIATFGPAAKTNWVAKALGLSNAELSVKHFMKAAFTRR